MVKVAKRKFDEGNFSAPAARPGPKPFIVSASSGPSRHQRKCTVCRHPERAAIEEEFLHWRSPASISRIYKIEERAVYRHARAFQLDNRRRRHLRFSLGHVLEQVHTVNVTPSVIFRGIKTFTHITEDGGWIKSPRPRRLPESGLPASAPPSGEAENLIDTRNRTKNAATYRQQSSGHVSNRQENTKF